MNFMRISDAYFEVSLFFLSLPVRAGLHKMNAANKTNNFVAGKPYIIYVASKNAGNIFCLLRFVVIKTPV
jgi:hypothetical protein